MTSTNVNNMFALGFIATKEPIGLACLSVGLSVSLSLSFIRTDENLCQLALVESLFSEGRYKCNMMQHGGVLV